MEKSSRKRTKTTGATIVSCCSATDPLDTYNQCFHTPYIRLLFLIAEEHNHLSIEQFCMHAHAISQACPSRNSQHLSSSRTSTSVLTVPQYSVLWSYSCHSQGRETCPGQEDLLECCHRVCSKTYCTFCYKCVGVYGFGWIMHLR